MLKLTAKEKSLLKPDGFKPTYAKLNGDISADTVIVGGGIAGMSAAYLLKKAGQKVAVLEKDAIGSGTTGHTTGKVTSQHNLVYADLYDQLGERKTKLYGQANQTSIEEISQLIKAEKIDCGWERADNYVYTTEKQRINEFKREAKIAQRLDLPASYETKSPLPFKIAAAVKFTDQAHFSGQKYVEGLAKATAKGGSRIYEQTRANVLRDGLPCVVETEGGQVTADNIIVATNVPTFPLSARASYCLFEYPQNSYLIAGRAKVKLGGMYISPDDGYYSILPVGKGDGQILLIGGENHIPGLGRAKPRHQKLAEFGERHFGMTKVEYRWHARDYIAYDNVPLIGKLYPWPNNMYVITAFKKWGLAHSMVAAMILRDQIMGQKNSWAEVFNSMRLSPIKSIPKVLAERLS